MPTSVRLPEQTEQRLGNLARISGRSKAFYIREAVTRYLDEMEDIALAEKRVAELKAGRTDTVTMEEVEKELGLAD